MITLFHIILSAIVILASGVFATIIVFFIRAAERKLFKGKSKLADEVISALIRPAAMMAVFLGIWFALENIIPDQDIAGIPVIHFYVVGAIVIGSYTAARLIRGVLKWYSTEIAPKTKSGIDGQVLPMLRKIIIGIIYVVGLIMILAYFGVQITPLLAGLGVAGLAIALALQEPLSNFFSGVAMLSDRPIAVGDYIKIESGEEGWVQEIGSRSVRIKTRTNDMIVIPNSVLAKSRIYNYSQPDSVTTATLSIGVGYDSDIEKVEKILFNTAKRVISKHETAVQDFDPIIRFNDFGDSSLKFMVVFKVNRYTDQFLIKHEMRKEILKAFRKARIEIPYPAQTVYVKGRKRR